MPDPTPLTDKLLLRPAEAGALLSLSETQTRELINDGELHAVRLRGRLRVPRSAVEAFIADLERRQQIEAHNARLLLKRNSKRRTG